MFRGSVGSVPPASFDERDVARASRRITARRRTAAVGGGAAAAAVLVVGGLAVSGGWFTGPTDELAGPPPAQHERSGPEPRGGQPDEPGAGTFGSDSGGSDSGKPGVLAEPRSGGCGPDRGLADAVADQLPEAAGTRPVPAGEGCSPGARAAAFELRDGRSAGNVTVIVGPEGAVDPAGPGESQRPDGALQAVREARSGQLVVVVSAPDAGSPAPPYGARLAAIAGGLADRY
nr:hypothetical protein [Saccharopolyspora sp. HNM0983]